MDTKNKFLETLDQEDMERLLTDLDAADFRIDPEVSLRIQAKTRDKIRKENQKTRKRSPLRYAAAALAVAAGLSFLSPQVRATMRDLFSFVPGVSAIQSEEPLLIVPDITMILGAEKLNGQPVILANGKGVQLNMQIFKAMDRNPSPAILNEFSLTVNGRALSGNPIGFTAGSDRVSTYGIYFEARVKSGDRVRVSHERLGFIMEGNLETLDAEDPQDLPHALAGDILTVAQPVKREGGWDIHMYALSDRVIPLSFTSSLEFDGPLVFETAEKTYPVEMPDSYGTGFMPALNTEGEGSGHLVIPSLAYTMDDKVKYTFRIPDEDEVYTPETGFTLAGVPVQVDRIYLPQENPGHIALDLTWSSFGTTTLDLFWAEGESAGIHTGKNGMTLLLEKNASLTGRRTITLSEPEFTLHEEVRIPLVLE